MRGSTARVELNLEQLRASAHAVGWTLRHGRGNPAVHRRASHEARTLKKFDTSGRHLLRRLMTSSANDPATRSPTRPLVELDVEQFSLPIATHTRSYFLTTRLAARRMVANRSGVIMTVTSTPSRTGVPLVGGGGPAMAAVEALTRGLSAELAPQGIRVVGLRPQAMPDTDRIKGSFELYAKASGTTWEQFHESLASRTHTRRLSTLEEIATWWSSWLPIRQAR
jgi:NAD(P)-dependent dehydrogenase (short-subunit alcohol dehydrogenase family)